ncbi:MAG: hypothetical protein ACR2MG_04885 [Pyrinomonadaceae bacterium]
MSYSKFTKADLKDKFGVELVLQTGLFDSAAVRPIGEWLKVYLANNTDFAILQATEKARSEFIIAPIFAELRQQAEAQISIFSGWELNVDVEQGLTGRCDFLVSRTPYQANLESPIVVAVEAKQQDFDKGTTQCIAEMIAARIFNEREGNPQTDIYGTVTTGDAWRFLVLRGQQGLIEPNLFPLKEIDKIFGILWAMTFNEISL